MCCPHMRLKIDLAVISFTCHHVTCTFTGIWQASQGDVVVLADVSSLAVGIPHTLWLATGDGVRVGDETRLTPADGIA